MLVFPVININYNHNRLSFCYHVLKAVYVKYKRDFPLNITVEEN